MICCFFVSICVDFVAFSWFNYEKAEGWLPEEVQDKLTVINNDPDKLSLALNAVVVFLFAAFAAYKLATVDLDVSRGWTWYEILLR